MAETKEVTFGELLRAFNVMDTIVETDTRKHLMRYLDGMPLPIIIRTKNSHYHGSLYVWDKWPLATIKKLDMLLGTHGHAIVKAWIAKQ